MPDGPIYRLGVAFLLVLEMWEGCGRGVGVLEGISEWDMTVLSGRIDFDIQTAMAVICSSSLGSRDSLPVSARQLWRTMAVSNIC